jgi:hypothetical protein
MVVVCKLERKIETGFSVESCGGHSHHDTSTTSHTDATTSHAGATGENGSSSSTELEEVAKSFDALDPSGNGRIESRELRNVFEAMGVHTSDENMAAILHVLDKNGDAHVAKDEFISFYSTPIRSMFCHRLGSTSTAYMKWLMICTIDSIETIAVKSRSENLWMSWTPLTSDSLGTKSAI